jgi:hypothetical protein
MAKAPIARTTTPPTTPPAIAPAWLDPPELTTELVVVDVEDVVVLVVDVVELEVEVDVDVAVGVIAFEGTVILNHQFLVVSLKTY